MSEEMFPGGSLTTSKSPLVETHKLKLFWQETAHRNWTIS